MKLRLREIGDYASLTVGNVIYDALHNETYCMYKLPKLVVSNGKIESLTLCLIDCEGIFHDYIITEYPQYELYLVVPDYIDCGVTKLISDTIKYVS